MDAEVTVKFIINNICDNEDANDDFFCLEDLVTDAVNEEGFTAFLDDLDSTYEITEVKKIG